MAIPGADSELFQDITRELLERGMGMRFQARGASMSPAIRDGEVVEVTPVIVAKLRKDDIVLTKSNFGLRLHRLVIADHDHDAFVTRGDCGQQDDPVLRGDQILGIAQAKAVQVGRRIVQARFKGIGGGVLRCAARGQSVLQKMLKLACLGPWRRQVFRRSTPPSYLSISVLLFLLLAATGAYGQVGVDATSNSSSTSNGRLTGPGTVALTAFAHTTTATANRLLIVGVAMDITNSTGATVSSITYTPTATGVPVNLTSLGAQNDAAPSRRVELWSLLAPASGNANIVVNVNVPTAATIGVLAGATTFSGVDQTVPLGTFVSADGEAAGCIASNATVNSQCNSQVNVPSVVNGMVFDTLATGENVAVTVESPQASQWSVTTGANANRDVRSTGSTRAGAPSVPVAEWFTNATSNWAQGAISINPSAADIGVTTSVAAVFQGTNTTYNITVFNNGPSAANTVSLSDTLASGMTFVSATPSTGSCVTTGNPITCNLGNLASGGTATVAVVETAATSGAYANTASVTDALTSPPDPNTGNNSFTAVATVQSAACAAVAQATAGGTLTGVVNTYYPGTTSVAAGATSIPLGAATGAGTAIAAGNLLLVIQMQDATINTSNSVAYGNGSTGAGFTALNSAGDYEFVTATNAVPAAGGTLTISGAGAGGGLVFGYDAAAETAANGQTTYQVILVPQYTTATLSSGLKASAWNGSTGGVLALDTSSTLTLGGATVAVDGLGFRGGAGLQLGGGGGSAGDFLGPAPATYTPAGTPPPQTTTQVGWHAVKGEGVAGTPFWVQSGGTFLATGTGYPNGTGADGSMGRGAPGNAGGGGTDADPGPAPQAGNDQNAGGGGGGNGGSGGFGGDSWSTNLSVGGEGGAAFPATVNRVAMGGGGGAGTRNNSNPDLQASSGSAGGGIIIIRANALSGTATLTANGAPAYNGTLNDAGGGAGAGGSIVVLSANGGEGGLTLNASGGTGGNAWQIEAFTLGNRHGPGGGGGGGVVIVSGAPAGVSVAGGASGLTENPGVAYGATAGAAGFSVTNASIQSTTGTQSGADCTPDMTLGKSHVGNFVRGSTASYTVPVRNLSPFGPSNGVVTINDTLPFGLTPTSAIGTGWSCSVSSQTLSCVRGDSVAGNSAYPSITINANVSQSAPATVTNTAIVAGGGEINLANDTATDVASVVSNADLSVTDSGTPNPVAAGANITYTQVVTNNGPSAADNATLVVNIPANTTFVSMATPAGWSCIGPGGGSNVVCTNVDMAGSTSGTFTLVVKVNAGTANGTVITAMASVSSSANDPNSANNTATVTTIVGNTSQNLSVTNVASPNPVQAGNNITYTQVVTNTGTTAATTATFTEATPANTTFASITMPPGWTCTPAPPPVSCQNASVAGGTSGVFTVVYTVNAGTASGITISDTATVNAANQSFGPNSATATDVVAAGTQADLALTTAATPGNVLSGNNITYTQTVTNNGPAAATGVSFTEATPTNTTFESVSPPVGWTCTTPAVGATGNVNCTDPNLAATATADIVVVVNVPATVATGTITANSSVTATTSDPNTANNSTTVNTPVSPACDLAVSNSGTPSPVAAGGTITYTQIVTNTGPSNCSTATFNEALPANTAFGSVSVVTTGGGAWACPNASPIACTNPSVPPGSKGTITAIYTVNGGTGAGTIITDTATVGTASRDTNLNNNSATVNIAVASNGQADLSLSNTPNPTPVTAGSRITFTQVVQNLGPATAGSTTAGSITLTETLPANTTVFSLTGPAGWTCSTVTLLCTNNANTTLAANTSATFTFVVTVNSGVASGTTITDTASVADTTPVDPNNANNSATASVPVADGADLSVTNTPSPVPVLATNNITYSQVISNAGPSTATNVTVTETLPANTTAQTLSGPAGWICNVGTLTCSNPSFAPGTPATITFVVKVNAGTASGTTISDTVSVSSATTDPNSSNNSATANDVVATGAQADLSVTNTAAPGSVAAGSNVTYTQSVQNLGPSAANGATFTQTTPPNTTFQSITPPAGWTCPIVPAVGKTGTITCKDAGNLALNATANFTLVLQVVGSTPSGTSITDTATGTATNGDTGAFNSSASATVIVANANSADMAIVKTATPNPVTEGTPLTYTLTVTNNGPATATTVTVTDTLPSVVTYLSSTSTQGTCSEAGGTVTCQVGTMANAATVTVTILTIPGAPGVVSNMATVTADQTDPNLANNSSTQTETITAPTKITLLSFSAHSGLDKNGASRVLLTWRTSGEAHNLGFNVYREENGSRVRMNPSIIAGSALLMAGALPKHAGRSYAWIDAAPAATDTSYWLEDIDVNGTRTLHGPISTEAGLDPGSKALASETRMFSQLSQAQALVPGGEKSHVVETMHSASAPTPSQMERQFNLAANPAVKISVQHEGWYRVPQPALVKAGLDPNVDPATLHLFAEATEQPMQITGATAGPGGFGQQAAINFYGTAIDTVFSGTRVYWLVAGEGAGARVVTLPASSGSNLPPAGYLATVELKQHTTYFAALLTANGENFFGALVSPTPTEQVQQVLHVPYFDAKSTQPAQLEVVLQGVIVAFPHDVKVELNGTSVGDVMFTGQDKGTLKVTLPPGLLRGWDNTVTLAAQNGDFDTSLVESIRITYPRWYAADSDELEFTGRAGDELQLSGFTSAPTVLDITDPNNPVQLTPQVTSNSGKYGVALQVPWTTTNPTAPTLHTLLAVGADRVAAAAGVLANQPSHWHSAQPGADIVMVTSGAFEGMLGPLVRAHQAEGKSSAVVPIADLYDEFNFGERSPFAIRQFLQSATTNWKKAPTYLLLNGRASFDPRNYLGFGPSDLVPTRLLPITGLMTASDDWFSDFNNRGMPTIATGRLPVGTADEEKVVVGKIAAYEGESNSGAWTGQALMVADRDDTESFTQDTKMVEKNLPATMQVAEVFAGTVGAPAVAQQDIVSAIDKGKLLVNYLGHGSEEQWSGSAIFDTNLVPSLTNGSQLPVFLIMNCLNGFFQDVYAQPLGVTLLLAPNGGAVAVLASTGLNQPVPQARLDGFIVQNALSASRPTLGESILKAKSKIGDEDVRRTYVLFGDPAMHIQSPSQATTH